ncbi:MAG: glutathione S-transferase [Rhodospirillaceae bacterium]|nr:glutathione S-transferase [Rhodospirillaceae bacterium]|tara:strand:+ start:195 stop:797 length:603 start_codon:yes stop_codon:yes gene_type:complete
MKLFFSPLSPFARKVRIVAFEKTLTKELELFKSERQNRPTELGPINPLLKVPTLVDNNGNSLFDSPVICEYLDSLTSKPVLFPKESMSRWAALRQQALGDGGMDDAVKLAYEAGRPSGSRSPYWLGRWRQAVESTLNALESEAPSFADRLTIGPIAIGCFLGFLDQSRIIGDWRGYRENLAMWFEEFRQRPSMQETEYKK